MLQSVVVASAVLVSAFHLLQWNVEIVKRWSNEIQEAVQSKSGMVQVGPPPAAALCAFRPVLWHTEPLPGRPHAARPLDRRVGSTGPRANC